MKRKYSFAFGILCVFLVILSSTAKLQARSTGTFAELVNSELTSLRTWMLSGNVGRELPGEEMQSYARTLDALAERVSDAGNGAESPSVENFSDLLEESYEAFFELESALRDREVERLDEWAEFLEEAQDNPEEISNGELLDEGFRPVVLTSQGNRLVETNRRVLESVTVYLTYAARSDPEYRADVLTRYLESLFSSLTEDHLDESESNPIVDRLYRGSIDLVVQEIKRIEKGQSYRRNLISLLRVHGRVLREISRGISGSSSLAETLKTINQTGRSLTGTNFEDDKYPFLK